MYQFYNLARLWGDINTALDHNIGLWHPATEPVSAADLYKHLTGEEFVNEISDSPVYYDYRSQYAEVFGGSEGYIDNKENVLRPTSEFVGAITQGGQE